MLSVDDRARWSGPGIAAAGCSDLSPTRSPRMGCSLWRARSSRPRAGPGGASSANAKRSAAIGWAASTVFGGFTVDAAAAQDGK